MNAAAVAELGQPETISLPLIVAYVGGDRRAFRELFELMRKDLYAVVARHFRGAFDQEEALQETLLKLYRGRERFDVNRHEEFVPWARQVARNCCLDLLKARARKPEVPLASLDHVVAATPGADESPAARAVTALVAELDVEQRRLFELYFVEERSHEEAARTLAVTPRRSKYLKKKLLARLIKRAQLEQARRK